MPTEFLHGLYDGGHGAGLADYWKLMMSNPRCAGGFLWDLMDQGVVRTDMNNIVDCMGNFGSDGIVGPHMEKEGSYYTIREVWSPIQLTIDQGKLKVDNCYNFTNLKDCKLSYKYLQLPKYGQTGIKTISQGTIPLPDVPPFCSAFVDRPQGIGDMLQITAYSPQGEEVFTWNFKTSDTEVFTSMDKSCSTSETDALLTVKTTDRIYTFSKENGLLQQVSVGGKVIPFGNGPRFVAAKRSDRSQDGFFNHDDKEAFKKKTEYTEYADQGAFAGFEFKDGVLTANYRHGSLNQVRYSFQADGGVLIDIDYTFNGVVDLLGVAFDYPEQNVKSKRWVGKGPYRVWQNRIEGPQFGYWQNDYNDPIPGETWEYPEFKGYFLNVDWMKVNTSEGAIGIELMTGKVGVYTPRDGRDHLLYDLPETGISILRAIPAVRNKVNTTDLNGPSAQPYWSKGKGSINAILRFE